VNYITLSFHITDNCDVLCATQWFHTGDDFTACVKEHFSVCTCAFVYIF